MPGPLHEVAITRPWHWGVAVLGDVDFEEVPVHSDGIAVIGGSVASVRLRHAQDVELGDEDQTDWFARATLRVRRWDREPDRSPRVVVVADGVMATPSCTLWVGDADENTTMRTYPSTRVLISVVDPTDSSPEEVWVDLLPTSDAGTPKNRAPGA